MEYLSKDYSIRDLAKECGISISTASKALNGYTDISPRTRELVIQTANKHGYIPNNAARNLKKRSSKNLVLLINDPWHPSCNVVIRTYNEAAKRANYKLVIRYVNDDDPIASALHAIKECKAVGIIMVGNTIAGREKEVGKFGIPVVVLEPYKELDLGAAENVSCFYVDDISESFQLTKYLIAKGAKKVALFTTEVDGPKVGGLRTEGYKMALKEAGLEIDPARIVTVKDIYFKSGYECAGRLVDQGNLPDALVCVSDMLSMGACRAFYERGIRVPEDVMVAGFDGSPFTDYSIPSLTSCLIPGEEIYRDSAQHIMDRISRNSAACHKCYTCKIMEKDSTRL